MLLQGACCCRGRAGDLQGSGAFLANYAVLPPDLTSPRPTNTPARPPARPPAPQTVDDERLTAAHYLLRPFMLRRLKEEVEQKLPPKVETRIGCPLSEMQTFWYRR